MAGFHRKPAPPGCTGCGHFENDPGRLESIFKGLTILCSGYASVRGDSGICRYEERFRMPRTACEHFVPKVETLSSPGEENKGHRKSFKFMPKIPMK